MADQGGRDGSTKNGSTDTRVFETDPDGKTRVSDAVHPSDSAESTSIHEMDFSTHILSLNTIALMHLGATEGVPDSERDVLAARHIVDTLEMLRTKTSGNLEPDEERLLNSLLYDLKLKCLNANA